MISLDVCQLIFYQFGQISQMSAGDTSVTFARQVDMFIVILIIIIRCYHDPAHVDYTGIISIWMYIILAFSWVKTEITLGEITKGVTLAQLVKASVGQADVQRFEPHLGHNWLSCGVFLVKARHFGLPLAQTSRPNWQSLSAGGSVAIQTWSIYKVYT